VISLTYFEFTTLAILQLLADAKLDVVILEVGLGGRLDAVNMLDADCAVITSIDLDHMEYLGPDRESIGREKAGIMRAGKPVIVSDPVPPQSVVDHAAAVGADLWRFGTDFNFSGDKQQWGWAGRGRRYAGPGLSGVARRQPAGQCLGRAGGADGLRERLPVTAQAVRNGLSMVELPGRFQIVPGQPTLVLDVAHNPHSVAALAENLDAMGFYPHPRGVRRHGRQGPGPHAGKVAPLVDKWYFTDLPTPRAATAAICRRSGRPQTPGPTPPPAAYPSPEAALQAAVKAATPADRIVVFGSFYTVGGILKDGVPRLSAPHLGQQDKPARPSFFGGLQPAFTVNVTLIGFKPHHAVFQLPPGRLQHCPRCRVSRSNGKRGSDPQARQAPPDRLGRAGTDRRGGFSAGV
jgi:dihydrofolate synthase/folylpolyglutamate synthase